MTKRTRAALLDQLAREVFWASFVVLLTYAVSSSVGSFEFGGIVIVFNPHPGHSLGAAWWLRGAVALRDMVMGLVGVVGLRLLMRRPTRWALRQWRTAGMTVMLALWAWLLPVLVGVLIRP